MMLKETPAMKVGAAKMFWCQNCGALIYVPDGLEKKRHPSGDCPACAKNMWTELRRGQGPFKWNGEDDE